MASSSASPRTLNSSTSDLAIRVRGLRKAYGAFEAVRGIDLDVARGEVFALLGPNGAGKTTTVEILEGYRERSAGEVDVLGYDPAQQARALKQRIGIVLQSTGVERYLTVEETLDMYRGYFPDPLRTEDVLDVVGLREQRAVRVKRLSGGQQRRLDVGVGLIGNPELLFLDEPTTGFDPSARRQAWEMVRSLRALGKTVFLTTHYMDEAQYLADRVAIIARGQVVAAGPPAALMASGDEVTSVRFRLPAGAQGWPDLVPEGVRSEDGMVVIETSTPTALLFALTRWAVGQSLELTELTVTRPSLEDVYLRLVGADAASDGAGAGVGAASEAASRGRRRRRRGGS
ncbi:MAG: ABC transporter ATP-binding protein [Dehalococcoidia bacterium]